jgi:Fic family protein
MSRDLLVDYEHLREFRKCWRLTVNSAINLGKCSAYIEALGALPITPDVQHTLRVVSFERGAQATTAIEGNTLSDEEVHQAVEGKPLPKSRQYQAQEVVNALGAMNSIRDKVVGGQRSLVTPTLLCDWNRQIGKDLGPLYDGVPGKFRTDRRHVSRYLAPPHEAVPKLTSELCRWLKKEFGFGRQDQSIEDAIQQAIAAHVYFEWIHPFADGNGRTGRLLEFYILLRAGLPDITGHVLANHYNKSRIEYSASFDRAREKRDLTEFMEYAIQGMSDGLIATMRTVQVQSFRIAWESHVYHAFDSYTDYNKRTVFKRRRSLALAVLPFEEPFTSIELVRRSDFLAGEYMGKDRRVLKSDIQVLIDLQLLRPIEIEGATKYRANIQALAGSIPSRALA